MTNFKDYSKTFQERLISIRNLRKMTQEELGLKTNMASSHIAHFESGSRKPSFDSICKLADGLSVSVDYLIGRSNKPESFYLAFKFEDYTDTLDKNDIDLLEYQIKEILKKKDDLIKLRIVKKPLDYSDILNIIKKINQLSTEDYLESLHNLKIHILNAGINPEIAIKNSSLYDSIYFLMSILNMLIFDLYHNPQDIILTNGILKLFLESDSVAELKTKFISIMKKADNEQDKVLVIVQGGVVSDILKEGDVEVSIFDHDNFKEGDDWSIPKGFEKLIPDWIKDELKQRSEEIIKDILING